MRRVRQSPGPEVASPAVERLHTRQELPAADKIAFRVRDASRVSGLSRSTLYALIGEGKLKSVKARGRRLILRSDLEAFFAQLQEEQT
jgi:excisionase family DNA binding protein